MMFIIKLDSNGLPVKMIYFQSSALSPYQRGTTLAAKLVPSNRLIVIF